MAARTHISALVGLALVVAASTASATTTLGSGRLDAAANRDGLAPAVRHPPPADAPTTTATGPTTSSSPTTTSGPTTTGPTTTIDGRPTAIISLGDSYISGEAGRWAGNSNSAVGDRDGTDRAALAPGPADPEIVYPGTSDNGCHRSDVAPILSTAIAVDAKINIACSAARTEHIVDTVFKGEAPQSQQLAQIAVDHDIRMVVLSIGGNDLRFADILEDCAAKFSPDPGPVKDLCNDEEQPTVDARMPMAMAGVKASIDAIRASMVAAGSMPDEYRLVVVSYPSPVPRGSEFDQEFPEAGPSRIDVGRCPVWDEDATWARDELVPQIADELRGVAIENGAEFLDLRDAFQGNEVCSATADRPPNGGPPDPTTAEWARWIDLADQGEPAEDLHPNLYGQQAYGHCLSLLWAQARDNQWRCTNTANQGPNAMILSPW